MNGCCRNAYTDIRHAHDVSDVSPVHNTPVPSHHRKVIYDCATDSFGRKVCHISFARRRTTKVVFDCSYSGWIDYQHTTHIIHREKKDHFQKQWNIVHANSHLTKVCL